MASEDLRSSSLFCAFSAFSAPLTTSLDTPDVSIHIAGVVSDKSLSGCSQFAYFAYSQAKPSPHAKTIFSLSSAFEKNGGKDGPASFFKKYPAIVLRARSIPSAQP